MKAGCIADGGELAVLRAVPGPETKKKAVGMTKQGCFRQSCNRVPGQRIRMRGRERQGFCSSHVGAQSCQGPIRSQAESGRSGSQPRKNASARLNKTTKSSHYGNAATA